jgi:D-3-phosphoglycerate dehydrogenase
LLAGFTHTEWKCSSQGGEEVSLIISFPHDYYVTVVFSTRKLPDEAKAKLMKWTLVEESPPEEAQVIMGWPGDLNGIIQRVKGVRYIQTFSAGVDDLNFDVLPKGVKVFSNAGAYSEAVAEHAWGLILSLAKGIGKRERVESYVLKGGQLLVVGCGGIGSQVALIGKEGFKMRTLGVSRSFKRPELFDERYDLNSLGEVIGRADVIAVALPLSKRTLGLINYDLLKRTKDKSIMVNVGRGEVVVEEDVYRVLRERPTFRFGTDVFWRKGGREDFNSKLWELPNFTGTPHTAGGNANQEVLRNALVNAAENVRRLLETGRADNEVKIEDYLDAKL